MGYCGECKHLNMTEKEQTDNRLNHICNKYNKRVCHFGHHPHILRLDICMREDSKEETIKLTLRELAKKEGIEITEESCPRLEMIDGNLKHIYKVYCDESCNGTCWDRNNYIEHS